MNPVMKTAFSGVRYDTSKADPIGSASGGVGIDAWRAGLYRTARAGRYFLAGQGSWMTRWAGKEGVVPLTGAEAHAWARQHLDETALAVMMG